MQIKILGCSGGIGAELRTTSMLVDQDILIDAGTGVGNLSMDELLKIDHIFLTHSHLDHIAFLPFLLDTVMGIRAEPINVYANKETLETLRLHIFNWKVWPDFNAIPSTDNPFLRYCEVKLSETLELNGRKFTPLPANHVVPAIGYHVDSGAASLVFTGDTTVCDELWHEVNKIKNLKYLIIETAFSNSELALAQLSKHLCPSLLRSQLVKLITHDATPSLEIYITHLKPGEGESIMQEIAESHSAFVIQALKQQQEFYL
ncbi:MAG: 3',5'-cyclic-nucleotide phosphodiesterase [Methylotenera sp.]|uniref:3',5'-cyclic-nucleotide phosphodiesterase n=1 Tax=Methylotenera sp. TaxID=2051956 RepID=UPI002489D05E|nr:3',5'-cyclic-nucleotide phosphodiesterase [Methylotenera sp.]MDI1310301.1 3',5'-cyclic-nucleotide phosphodiesterase [Methylotenera sp.]